MTRLLDEVACDLRGGCYRLLAARRVFISKPGTAERRPLSIPTVRDRIVQATVKVVLELIFEADMLPCSFGFAQADLDTPHPCWSGAPFTSSTRLVPPDPMKPRASYWRRPPLATRPLGNQHPRRRGPAP